MMSLIFLLNYDKTNIQVANLRKIFAYNSSTDIKLSKTQLHKMIQPRGFLLDFFVHY